MVEKTGPQLRSWWSFSQDIQQVSLLSGLLLLILRAFDQSDRISKPLDWEVKGHSLDPSERG